METHMRKLNATIYRVNKWQEKCEKDRMPHVGVFYVIEGKVFVVNTPESSLDMASIKRVRKWEKGFVLLSDNPK